MRRKRKPRNKKITVMSIIIIALLILSSAIVLILQFTEITGLAAYSIAPPEEVPQEEPIPEEPVEIPIEPEMLPEPEQTPETQPEKLIPQEEQTKINKATENYQEPQFESSFIAASDYDIEELLHDLDKVSPNLIVSQAVGGDYLGSAVSSGDINNDGIDDWIIGAHKTDPNGADAGTTYVIFGSSSYTIDSINLGTASANLTIHGKNAGDWLGSAVASGDINNDSIDDVIIGAYLADPNGDQSGEAYVIFGSSIYANHTINLSSVSANITIYGNYTGDRLGSAVASGDINNDSIDDIIIGAPLSNPNGGNSGTTYVIFGSSIYANHTINLSSTKANLTIYGNSSSDYLGTSVFSADINNDSIADVITGAYGADPHGDDEGTTYVIFGSGSFTNDIIDLNLIQANLTVHGDDTDEFSGFTVSSGDINGDTIGDVIIGAYGALRGVTPVGRTYVIFGSSTYNNNVIDLRTESANLTVQGDDQDDQSGSAVSSGDINNDGIDDVIIAAHHADPNGLQSGEIYVIFGSSTYANDLIDLDATSANITIYGDDANDYFGGSVSSGDLNNDGIADIFVGAETAGEAYAFFGTICPCHNCSDCETKLNDSYCSIIQLSQNITNHAGTCINSPTNFNNKTFDCLNNNISGDGTGYGIYLDSKNNSIIRNCNIRNFTSGIYLSIANDNSIINNNVFNNSIYGIGLVSSHNNTISNNTIRNNVDEGIFILSSDNNTVINCMIYKNTGDGITINASEYSTLIDITSHNNTVNGIRILSSNYTYARNITCRDNSNNGLYLYLSSDNNNFTNVTCYNNGGDGIYLRSSNNIFANVDCYLNSDGIYMRYADNNNLTNLNIYNNTGTGLLMRDADNNTITGLHSCNNSQNNDNTYTGLYMRNAHNNNLTNLIINKNRGTGIDMYNINYNNMFINVTANNNLGDGISIRTSTDNNTFINITANNNGWDGIFLDDASYNNLTKVTVYHNGWDGGGWVGIFIDSGSAYNTIIDADCYNNSDYGIWTRSSSNNDVINSISQNNTISDWHSTGSSLNTVTNLTSYQNNISFISFDASVKGLAATEAPANPASRLNINKWINATSNSADSWLFINFSYSDSDIPDMIIESSLKIWKYNASGWVEDGWNTTRVLDTTNKVVGVNITNFASTYAPLGSVNCTCINCTDCIDKLNDPNCLYIRLTQDITAQSGECINDPINFSNKTFDCQNFVMDGDGIGNSDYGIYLSDTKQNNTITNCIIKRFARGIHLVDFSSYNNITNNTFYNNTNGIYMYNGCEYNNITNNNISGNTQDGIYTDASSSNLIKNNSIMDNGDDGIHIYGGAMESNNVIMDNIIQNNTNSGINFESEDTGIIANNTIYKNSHGIYFSGSTANNITDNDIFNNTNSGIYINSYSNNNIISYNNISNNNEGIYLDSCDDNEINYNNIINNTNYGIYLTASSSNTIANNTIEDNTLWDWNSTSDSLNNVVTNLTSYQNSISFLSKDIAVKGLLPSEAPANPSRNLNINKWINATSNSADSWLFINFSYSDSDTPDMIIESSLKIWKYNASGWVEDGWNTTRVLDTTNKVVGVNITNFASTYAPFGSVNCTCINCTDCELKLNHPGCLVVNLTKNITNHAGTCINDPVNFTNKTFDCLGHTIDGSSANYGIYVDNQGNNTIRNCIISDFSYGIYLENSNYNHLVNNTMSNNSRGFYLYNGCDRNNITNNNISNNLDYGIRLDAGSNNNIINDNTIKNSTTCLRIDASDYNTADDNNIWNCTLGIYMVYSDYNIINNNNISKNPTGMNLSASLYNNITNNNIFNNRGSGEGLKIEGILVDEWFPLESGAIISNTGQQYSPLEWVFYNSGYNYIANNSFWNNTQALIFSNASSNTVDNNEFWDNDYAICINSTSTNNNLTGNTVLNSTVLDFYSDDSSTSNTINNLTIGTAYPTKLSFTYIDGIKIKSVKSPASSPSGKTAIGKYANISNYTSTSSINLNISYSDSDIPVSTEESTLGLYRYSSSAWGAVAGVTVDTANNIANKNITAFSDFGLFVTSAAEPTTPGTGGGGTRPGGCISLWNCSEWSECSREGIQTRICIDLNNCQKPRIENQTCIPPSCLDGILNQGELKINQIMSADLTNISDCGGLYCPACPTCDDGIQNQFETGIDSGGPCLPRLELPAILKEINLLWLLLILLIALTISDAYCVYENYHRKNKLTRKTYELLSIIFLVAVLVLSAYLSYFNLYVLAIPTSLIIYIIIISGHFSMPAFIKDYRERRRKLLAEKYRKKQKKKQEKQRRKQEKRRAKGLRKSILVTLKKERKLRKGRVREQEKRRRENRKKLEEKAERRQYYLEKKKLMGERESLLEEQKERREKQYEKETLEIKKQGELAKIEKQRRLEQERIEREQKTREKQKIKALQKAKRHNQHVRRKILDNLRGHIKEIKKTPSNVLHALGSFRLPEKPEEFKTIRETAGKLKHVIPEKPKELKKPSKVLETIGKTKLPEKPSELEKIQKTIGKTSSRIFKTFGLLKLPEKPKELKKPSKVLETIGKTKLPEKPSELEKIQKTIGKTSSKLFKTLGAFKLPEKPKELKKPSKVLETIGKTKLPEKPSELEKIQKKVPKILKKIGLYKTPAQKRAVQKRKEQEIKEHKKLLESQAKQKQASQKEYSKKLNNFLNKAVSAGYEKNHVKKLLINNGWPKNFVDQYCDRFFEASVKQAPPKKEEYEKTLDDFIIKSIKKQMSKKEIQKALTLAGWPKHFVKSYVGEFFETTKFHRSFTSNLIMITLAIGILCARKQPISRRILSIKNHLILRTSKIAYLSSLMGVF